MHITVITPIYGVEKYIEKNLTSLFNQTKTNGVEFILINDCTKDSSMEIARRVISEYQNLDIKIVEHEINKGLPSARQSGLDIATGDYILHIDSDDWCDPGMLEDLYTCAIENNADVVICDYFETFPNKEIYRKQVVTSNNGIDCIEDMYKRKFVYAVWNKLVKRSIYTDNNIPTVPNINIGEDLILNSRLLCYARNVVHLPKAYVHYRRNPYSLTAQDRISIGNIKSHLEGIEAIENFFKDRGFFNMIGSALNYRKVLFKYKLLIDIEPYLLKQYSKIYPEATNYIFKQTALSTMKRIIIYLASIGILFPLNMLRYMRNSIKK